MANSSIQKRYYYKIYDVNQRYITTWTKEVVSDPTFRSVVNAGAGELKVQLARHYDNFGEGMDVALQNRVEMWVADGDNLANNAGGGTVWDTAQWDVDLWDSAVLSFIKLFSGFISAYAPNLDDENQYIDITVLGYAAEASYRMLKDSSNNLTVTYTSQDPGAIMKDIVDKYRADGGTNLNYVGNSVQLTGTTVTYTFVNMSLSDCFDKIASFCPNGWFWFIDANGTVFLKDASATADHNLTIGKEIGFLQTNKRIENLINTVYIIGGGTPPLFNEYQRAASIATYGKFEKMINDGRVTDDSTADAMALNELDRNQSPETRAVIRIVDNNGEDSGQGANIENFQIGDTIQVKNLNYGTTGVTTWDDAVWDTDVWDSTIQFSSADIMIIQSLIYYPDYIEIEASSRLPELSKRIEDVHQDVSTLFNQGTPVAPTVRAV